MKLLLARITTLAALLLGYSLVSISVVLAQEEPIPRPTGTLEVLSGPVACDDQDCYEISVSCPEVAAPATARLKVAGAEGAADKGTIIFVTGGSGTNLYEEGAGGRRAALLESVRRTGFQTVQLQWKDAWFNGSPGSEEGHARLACRPATVARWVNEHLASQDPNQALCAIGHSGGAAQVSYMLSHYGLDDVLDAVVPTGGPVFALMGESCPIGAIGNAAFGYFDEPRTCDEDFLERLRAASVASGSGDYFYPTTMVSFVFEGIDNTGAVASGTIYHDMLKSEGSPMVQRTVVPDVRHSGPNGLYSVEAGANQVLDSLFAACQVWE